jgi:hypothetical protein
MEEDNKESAKFPSGNGSDFHLRSGSSSNDSEDKRKHYRNFRYGHGNEAYE